MTNEEKDERLRRKVELMLLSSSKRGDVFISFEGELPNFLSLGSRYPKISEH